MGLLYLARCHTPYVLQGNCVHKQNADKSAGEVVPGGCHDTHEQALAHMRALYANVPDATKTKNVTPPNLQEATGIQNCANCTYYVPGPQQHGTCKQYSGYGVDEDDVCNTWEGTLNTMVKDVVSAVASPYGLHGPNSLLGVPGLASETRKKRRPIVSEKVMVKENSGFLVSGENGDHLPTRKNGKLDHGLMGGAWAALHGGYRGNKYEGPNKSEAIAKLTALYKSEGIPTPDSETAKTKGIDPNSAFTQFKQADGRWRWVLTSTSGFSDRDGETIPTALLSNDVARMKSTGSYGALRWHHVGSENANPITRDPGKGLDLGNCDFLDMHSHTRVDSGNYYDERIGDALQPHLKSLGGSLGFFYARSDPDAAGVYHKPIWTFERSVLPRESASNWMATALKHLLHKEADVNDVAVKALKDKLGPENAHLVDDLLKGIDQKEAALMGAGVGVKAKQDEAKEDPKEEAAETPEEEAKENADEMKKKTKDTEDQTVALVAQISDAIATKMAGAFVTPAMLDAKFAELQATATKSVSEQTTALKALSDRLAVLEGETPESKRGFKASSATDSLVANPLMLQALQSLASTQGLDLSALGVKGAQPVDDTTRITERMMNFKPGSMGA